VIRLLNSFYKDLSMRFSCLVPRVKIFFPN